MIVIQGGFVRKFKNEKAIYAALIVSILSIFLYSYFKNLISNEEQRFFLKWHNLFVHTVIREFYFLKKSSTSFF